MKNFGVIFKFIALIGVIGLIYWKFFYTPDTHLSYVQAYDSKGVVVRTNTGRPAIVSYYQTWCADCIRETPVLSKFSRENGIDLYLISDESEEKINKFKSRLEPNLPFYNTIQSLSSLGIKKFPTVYFFDKTGKMLFKKLEVVNEEDLKKFLSQIQ